MRKFKFKKRNNEIGLKWLTVLDAEGRQRRLEKNLNLAFSTASNSTARRAKSTSMPSIGMEIYGIQFPKQKNETARIQSFFSAPDGTSARANGIYPSFGLSNPPARGGPRLPNSKVVEDRPDGEDDEEQDGRAAAHGGYPSRLVGLRQVSPVPVPEEG